MPFTELNRSACHDSLICGIGISLAKRIANICLNELADRFKKQSKNISKIHLNFKKEIANKPELCVLVVQILRKANCET